MIEAEYGTVHIRGVSRLHSRGDNPSLSPALLFTASLPIPLTSPPLAVSSQEVLLLLDQDRKRNQEEAINFAENLKSGS